MDSRSPEPSITRLLSESADLRRTIHSLELQLRDSRETSKALSAQMQGLKARAEEADSQMRLSSASLEETMRRGRDSETEKLAEKCERLEEELKLREEESDTNRRDLNSCKTALSAAYNTIETLKNAISGLETDRENSRKQSENALQTEEKLEKTVSDLRSEVLNLHNKVQTIGEEKVRLEIELVDVRRVGEIANRIQAQKEKEVNGLRNELKSMENELKIREKEIEKVQNAYNDGVIMVRTECERRIEEIIRENQRQEAEIKADHAEEISALRQHYNSVLETLERTAKNAMGSEREQWQEEVRALRLANETASASVRDSYMPNEEAEERIEAVRVETESDIELLRENFEEKMREERANLRKEQRIAVDQVTSQLRLCENERNKLSSRLITVEKSLNSTSDRLQEALQKTQIQQSHLQSLQSALTQANSEVEEMTFTLADLKRENSDLQYTCNSLQTKVEEGTAQRNASGKKLRERVRRWKAECQRLADSLETVKWDRERVEKEKEIVMERERNWLETARRMRTEEEAKQNIQQQTQSSLEANVSALQSSLQSSQDLVNAQSAQLSDMQDINSRIEAEAAANRTIYEERLNQMDRRLKEAKGRTEAAKKMVKEVVSRHFRIVKGVRQECVMRVALLRTTVAQELQAFQSAISAVSTRIILATDTHLASLNRRFQASSRDQQSQIETLQQQLQDAFSNFKAFKDTSIARDKASKEELRAVDERMRVEQEGRRKLEREVETLRQELKVKEELTGRLAKDFTGIQQNVQKLKEENAAVRERSKAEATARLQTLEAAYSSDLQRLQAAHQQAQHQSEISLNSLRSQLEDFKTAQNQESEQMTNLFKQKLSDKDSQITTLRETVKAQIEEIASLRSDLDNLRKKTEGPLAALQGEIEALAKGLRQEQSRCRLILERKDRELDNLRGELRQWQSRSTTL